MTAERLCQFQATDNPSAGAIQSDVVPRILRGNIVEFHGKKTILRACMITATRFSVETRPASQPNPAAGEQQ